ncbi:laccase [Vararia minispora EC-137]|uniref:Laccase n=1 Tax=Vararia minispora EC-137 TaxID=1314806 RepID=A0ACB8Q7T1_9AGAM|nr:laccase [Vararia minispora EC-137]
MFPPFRTVVPFLQLLCASGSLAATVVQNLVVSNSEFAPDGYNRLATLVNEQFPGPVIKGNKGDNFHITVNNLLHDDRLDLVTSVHWHGIDQHRTNWADGVSSITQCPIIPGESFKYQFNVPDQAGTFWYHSNQYCDGLRGVFVVYDPQDANKHLYDVDDESTIITLGDWYHYLSVNRPAIPEATATLINGKGRYAGGPNVPLSVINVKRNLRYRFRIVAMSCDSNYMFSIDQHNLTVIEADSRPTQPHQVSQIQPLAGQRYSVILNADQPINNYWIRAIRSENDPTIVQSIAGGQNAAILRYAGAKIQEPAPLNVSNLILLNEADLRVRREIPLSSDQPIHSRKPPADAVIPLNVTVDLNAGLFLVNGVAFQPPSVPVLLQILSGTKDASDLLPKGAVYGLQRNKTYELVVPAGALGGPHPLHLHGHDFWVVQSAGGTLNDVNPVLRDTVSMGNPGDNVRIRFRTDNPGPWFFHCHVDWHLTAGFAVVFAEDVPDVPQVDAPPQAWEGLCPRYDQWQNTHNITSNTTSAD